MHNPWQAVIGRAINPEIRSGFTLSGQLGTYSSVIGDERAVRQVGPVGPDSRIEFRDTSGIDIEVVIVDPLHIGAKSHAAGEIERNMDTEPARHWCRIDEPIECGTPRVGKIISLGEYEPRHTICRITFGGTRELLSAVTSRIHHCVDRERSRLRTTEPNLPAGRGEHKLLHRGV